jgi:predicted DNA-binding protein (UPF0251 family)
LDGTACLGDLLGEDDPPLDHTVDLDSVLAHWDELDGQGQQLLTLRFYGNLTQDEISRRLGVSQMQVSRLLRRTLDYLRGCLLPLRLTALPHPRAPRHQHSAPAARTVRGLPTGARGSRGSVITPGSAFGTGNQRSEGAAGCEPDPAGRRALTG